MIPWEWWLAVFCLQQSESLHAQPTARNDTAVKTMNWRSFISRLTIGFIHSPRPHLKDAFEPGLASPMGVTNTRRL
jgi:hypothetical protein